LHYSCKVNGYTYSTAMTVLFCDIVKLVVSLGFFYFEEKKAPPELKRLGSANWEKGGWFFGMTPGQSLLWLVPALLYCISNNTAYICFELLDSPALYSAFKSTEVLVVAFFSIIIWGRSLSAVQWSAMAVLVDGVLVCTLAKKSIPTENLLEAGAFTMLHVSCSALASVWIEKMYKYGGFSSIPSVQPDPSISFWHNNCHLCVWATVADVVYNLVFAAVYGKTEVPDGNGGYLDGMEFFWSFHGWNNYCYLIILNLAFMGLATGGVLKTMSAVVKVFVQSAQLLTAIMLTAVLIPDKDQNITMLYMCGVCSVLLAIVLYKSSGAKDFNIKRSPEEEEAASELPPDLRASSPFQGTSQGTGDGVEMAPKTEASRADEEGAAGEPLPTMGEEEGAPKQRQHFTMQV